MAFVSGVGGIGDVGSNLTNSPLIPSATQLRTQEATTLSPHGVAQLNAAALAQLPAAANTIPAAHLLYQQLLAGAPSQLIQGATLVSQAPSLLAQNTPTQSPSQPQTPQQQPNQAFLANAAQALLAAQGQLTINQLLLHNPLQQQVQAVLAHLLNPLVYYQQCLLQQSTLNAASHVQQPTMPAVTQNGVTTVAAAAAAAAAQQQQQKMFENLLVEQAVRNSTQGKIGGVPLTTNDTRNVGLLTSPESVKEHISRLISENEAILEQNPGFLKRRPYHRQVGSQSSVEMDTGIRSQSNSPGVRDVRTVCSRSQSFYETHTQFTVRSAVGGSLTSGQPIVRLAEKGYTCNYCQLKFLNDAALEAHEIRCSKRAEFTHAQAHTTNLVATAEISDVAATRKQSVSSCCASPITVHENRHPLKRRLLAAAEHLDEQQASTSKAPKLEITKAPMGVSVSPIGILHPGTLFKTTTAAVASVTTAPAQTVVSEILVSTTAQYHTSVAASTSSSAESLKRNYRTPTSQCTSVEYEKPEKPYILTLHDSSSVRSEGNPRRNRMRNITTETFATLNKTQPIHIEHKAGHSMYRIWPQSNYDAEYAKLNLLYMSTCSTKPRIGVKPLWRYTTALREMGVLKVTHSSFWDYSTKMRLRQNAVANAASAVCSHDAVTTFIYEQPAAIASTSATLSMSNVKEMPVFENRSDIKFSLKSETPRLALSTSSYINRKTLSQESNDSNYNPPKSLSQKIVGGYRTSEVYVYVRGRGRGRYVCDRCGIRCKKPSMLKKHIRSHSDIRPFGCKQCNFNFKTKGNLTKHLQSKAHRRRLAERQHEVKLEQDSDSDHDRLEIASPVGSASSLSNDPLSDDECTSDEEMRPPCDAKSTIMYRKFGQELILVERTTHTPPTLWVTGELVPEWPNPVRVRTCHSAPPSTRCPSEDKKNRDTKSNKETTQEQNVAQKLVTKVVTQPLNADAHDTHAQGSSIIPSVGAFLAKETMVCDICKREFRSSTEMSLHRKIHLIGPSSSRVRLYQCTECKHSVRSRNALNRHMGEKHGIADGFKADPNDSDNEENASSLSSLNPRSFMCTDCNIGFRKHGILAKHLRSKTHVMKLESLRIIPEDSLALITRKEGMCLNEIDTTDCDHARQSIMNMITSLRESSQFECREQMLQSPAPQSLGSVISASKKQSPVPSPSHNISEKRTLMPQQLYGQKRVEGNTKQNDPLQKRAELNVNARRIDELNAKSLSANVWIPPKADPLTMERRSVDLAGRSTADSAVSDNGSSVRSDEANSEGAGRSESSTPTQRLHACAPSPLLPPATRCTLCEVNYETSFDLQVHLHADHIQMRDGKDFCCPKKRCGLVYPNRENLRQHIAAHYNGGANTPTHEMREVEVLSSMTSEANGEASLTHRKLVGTPNQHANSVPNHSPNAPEESLTASMKNSVNSPQPTSSDPTFHSNASSVNTIKHPSPKIVVDGGKLANGLHAGESSSQMAVTAKRSSQSNVSITSSTTPLPALLPCAICGQAFPDAFALQRHWLSHVCDRPHICKLCDAGFTTPDALRTHSLTHSNSR